MPQRAGDVRGDEGAKHARGGKVHAAHQRLRRRRFPAPVRQRLTEVTDTLGHGGASKRAAEAVLREMKN